VSEKQKKINIRSQLFAQNILLVKIQIIRITLYQSFRQIIEIKAGIIGEKKKVGR
jgi:hypothetical protein